MRPKCLKCVFLSLQSLFELIWSSPKRCLSVRISLEELRLSRNFKGAFLFHPKVLAAVMALDEGSRA